MVAWFHSVSFPVCVVTQMVPQILYGRLWVFHGNLPLKLTVDHFWGNNSSGLEKELKSEKEQRQALQRELQREKDTSCLLQTELQQVEGLKKVRAAYGQHTRLQHWALSRTSTKASPSPDSVWEQGQGQCFTPTESLS